MDGNIVAYQVSLGTERYEWPYKVGYDAVNRVKTDILVIGGGLAGCCAGIAAARRGLKVAIVDKAPIKRSGCGVGIVLNLVCCRAVKMPAIAAKVSCITFVLVTLVLQGEARLKYALLRVLGTVIGALIALLLSWIYDKLFAKKNENV